jgi:hypothetical protein
LRADCERIAARPQQQLHVEDANISRCSYLASDNILTISTTSELKAWDHQRGNCFYRLDCNGYRVETFANSNYVLLIAKDHVKILNFAVPRQTPQEDIWNKDISDLKHLRISADGVNLFGVVEEYHCWILNLLNKKIALS